MPRQEYISLLVTDEFEEYQPAVAADPGYSYVFVCPSCGKTWARLISFYLDAGETKTASWQCDLHRCQECGTGDLLTRMQYLHSTWRGEFPQIGPRLLAYEINNELRHHTPKETS